jgi:hypothetical protein
MATSLNTFYATIAFFGNVPSRIEYVFLSLSSAPQSGPCPGPICLDEMTSTYVRTFVIICLPCVAYGRNIVIENFYVIKFAFFLSTVLSIAHT